MTTKLLKACVLLSALAATGTAAADHNFGVGVKAGTLGIGVEGTWRPLPYIDLRLGANQYDYADGGVYGGVNYDAEITLDNYYLTGNVHFPLSPFRLTGGLYSNGNEFNAVSGDNGAIIFIGGDPYPSGAVGTVSAGAAFDTTSPYVGVGFDFTVPEDSSRPLIGTLSFDLTVGSKVDRVDLALDSIGEFLEDDFRTLVEQRQRRVADARNQSASWRGRSANCPNSI